MLTSVLYIVTSVFLITVFVAQHEFINTIFVVSDDNIIS